MTKSTKMFKKILEGILFSISIILCESVKIESSNTTVGNTQYHVKKVMFKRYDNLIPTADANTHSSIREITDATTK